MRLINTANLGLEEFFDKTVPDYAILSHTWGQNEVILADYDQRVHRERESAADDAVMKIREFCNRAAKAGHSYAWVDTCCIDKKSSAELSEAINSMYRWYENAEICYVYFSDVSKQPSWKATMDAIRQARWFTRGWTLQELLAPGQIKFYDCNWNFIGGRWKREDGGHGFSSAWHSAGHLAFPTLISEITGIDLQVIKSYRRSTSASVAERMSWAAERVTTRREDIAYCLLGLFDVHIPLLYGEGDKAFTRLQAAIMEATDDHTIFAWDYGIAATHSPQAQPPVVGCLAQSPSNFKNGYLLGRRWEDEKSPTTSIKYHYSITNLGVQITLPVIDLPEMRGKGVLAALACTRRPNSIYRSDWIEQSRYVVAIPLYQSHHNSILFHRPRLQTRPLLVKHSVFQGSRSQMMYIEMTSPDPIGYDWGNGYGWVSSSDDDLSCAIGGVNFSITERFPYCIGGQIKRGGDTKVSHRSVTFYMITDSDRMARYVAPPGDLLTVGLKFAKQDEKTNDQNSLFIVMQFYRTDDGRAVSTGFRLVSGLNYSSLTTFIMDEKAIAAAFQMPTGDIILRDLGGCKELVRLRCHQFESIYDPLRGYDIFKFCLEAV
ncbi:Nn.00g097330.m01.CDS01 [Neocucurbitaria sp. VM-36]